MRILPLVPAGLALAGLLLVALAAANVATFGFETWMSSNLVLGLGLLLAGAGTGVSLRGHDHGHGRALTALGFAVGLAGGVADVGFTMAWAGRTGLHILAAFLGAGAFVQASWYALMASADRGRPEAQTQLGQGLALAVLAAAFLLAAIAEAGSGLLVHAALRLLAAAGVAMGATGLLEGAQAPTAGRLPPTDSGTASAAPATRP